MNEWALRNHNTDRQVRVLDHSFWAGVCMYVCAWWVRAILSSLVPSTIEIVVWHSSGLLLDYEKEEEEERTKAAE